MKDLIDFPENLDQQEEEQASCTHPYLIHNGAIYTPLASHDEEDIYSLLKVKPSLLTKVLAYECLDVSKNFIYI